MYASMHVCMQVGRHVYECMSGMSTYNDAPFQQLEVVFNNPPVDPKCGPCIPSHGPHEVLQAQRVLEQVGPQYNAAQVGALFHSERQTP